MEATILPALCKFIEIPNQSPAFHEEGAEEEGNRLLKQAAEHLVEWINEERVPGTHTHTQHSATMSPIS